MTILSAPTMFPILLHKVVSLLSQDTESCPGGEPLGPGKQPPLQLPVLAWEVESGGVWEVPCMTNSLMQLESIWEWKNWHTCRHQEITQFSTNYTIQQLVS